MKTCAKCGVRVPFHRPFCPEPGPLEPALGDRLRALGLPLLADEQPDTLPGRPGFEVTQRSRFEEEES